MSLTRLQMFQFVLDQAQLPATEFYLAKCRLYYRMAVDELSLNKDFKFYNKVVDTLFVASQKDYALPTDYQRSDACWMLSPSGDQGSEIMILDSYQYDPYRSTADGLPIVAMIDLESRMIQFNTAASNPDGKKYRLRYFRKPTEYSLTSSDDGVVPDFEPYNVVIQKMMSYAFEREDDERQGKKDQDFEKATLQYERNMLDSDASSSVDLSRENFRGRRGWGRRWGGGGGW